MSTQRQTTSATDTTNTVGAVRAVTMTAMYDGIIAFRLPRFWGSICFICEEAIPKILSFKQTGLRFDNPTWNVPIEVSALMNSCLACGTRRAVEQSVKHVSGM